MKVKINLVTMTDVQKFINAVEPVEENVTLQDSAGHCVSAKSMLGAIYTMEWAEVYCHCTKDISGLILPWIV